MVFAVIFSKNLKELFYIMNCKTFLEQAGIAFAWVRWTTRNIGGERVKWCHGMQAAPWSVRVVVD